MRGSRRSRNEPRFHARIFKLSQCLLVRFGSDPEVRASLSYVRFPPGTGLDLVPGRRRFRANAGIRETVSLMKPDRVLFATSARRAPPDDQTDWKNREERARSFARMAPFRACTMACHGPTDAHLISLRWFRYAS